MMAKVFLHAVIDLLFSNIGFSQRERESKKERERVSRREYKKKNERERMEEGKKGDFAKAALLPSLPLWQEGAIILTNGCRVIH
jgi:hypothetical protein